MLRLGRVHRYLFRCQIYRSATYLVPTITQGCYEWYTIVDGDGCGSVETKFHLTPAQFFALNPELYSNCTNLILGDAYCVAAIPTSTATSTSTQTATTTTLTSAPTPTNIEPGSWTKCV